jgi:uncharacterized RDD family membrane protein YckC
VAGSLRAMDHGHAGQQEPQPHGGEPQPHGYGAPPPPAPASWPAWQQQPAPYWGQTPYYGPPYGPPPVAPWPAPIARAPQVKSPPGEHPKELPWRLAGWWSRVGAQLLDLLVVWVPGGILLAVLLVPAASADDGSGAQRAWLIAAIVASFLVMAAHLFYAPLLMRRAGRRNGQTFGKQVTGIRVIRADGEPMSFSQAALRQIIYKSFGSIVASTFVPLFPWILNYLWPTWDEQHRALHDLAADTRVVAA